jgi:hypothetical protein
LKGKEMSLAFNRFLNTTIGDSKAPSVDEQETSLSVTVVFTSLGATLAALNRAGGLAKSLGARITLIVPQVVPYPLPLANPPVPLEFQERRFREIAAASAVAIQVQLFLCRDGLETLKKVLRPHSLIVIGGRNRPWPTREKGLARKLRHAGHDVIFTESR